MSGSDDQLNLSGWTCPIPLRNYPTVVMGHGSGGKMMADLIEHLFVPLFDNDMLAQMGDSTVLDLPVNGDSSSRLAFSTDSFVVSPLIFPGGDIGELAVNGTVNDLAMTGARPLFLSAGFILEEGLPMDTLGQIATSVADACRAAKVQLVTGDTKVVNKGHGDGLYINTSGIGLIPAGVNIAPNRAQPGDAIIVSGTVGDHGMAIMSVREGLEFETQIESDTAPLNGLVYAMLTASQGIRCLRDATRGGLAAVLHELANASNAGVEIEEQKIPVQQAVHAACEMLGMDPFFVANEGKLVAIVPESESGAVLEAMRAHPFGQAAARIGSVTGDHPGMVVAKTGIGGSRVVDLPAGELLPRIC
jgi:hydrogenase expression/formation protein HypE